MQEWRDEAVVLRAKPFGEGKLLAELFARNQGRCGGMAHSQKRHGSALQPGNVIFADWRARTADQLGSFQAIELHKAHAAGAMHDPAALAAIGSASELLRVATPERQPYPPLFAALEILLEQLGQGEIWPALYARFELGLLSALGYGLDLSSCALTGVAERLRWVSPRSGRAANEEAGAPYAEKLLRLPAFLTEPHRELQAGDVADALALSGYFLETRVFESLGQGVPPTRRRLIEALGYSGRL